MGSSNSTPTDKYGCPEPVGSRDYSDRGTAWSSMRWTALGCTGVTLLICLALIFQHLRRYRAPKEQRQIIRIAFSIPLYSVIAFLDILRYKDAQYIDPLGDMYEAFGLCALFLLFIQYAAPSGTFDEQTFDAVKAQEETATSFAWPKISWIFVFQYPIVEFLCLIIEESTLATGHFCEASLSPKFGHLWVEIISSVSIGACVISILKFRGHMKGLMKGKRGLSKIGMFKGVVFLRFTQQWIFSILLSTHAIKTSDTFRYNDILWGIPATLTCAEMVLFAAGFWYAFSASEYSSTAHPGPVMPMWKAIPHAMNPTDLIMGMLRVVPLFLEVRRSGDWSGFRAAKKEQSNVLKGVRAFRNRGAQGAVNSRYEELPSGRQSPYKPADSHHTRNMSNASYGDADAYGRLSVSNVYQPPAGSPPADASAYLMAEAPQSPPRNGQWNGATYESYGRSRSPSPGRM